MSTIYFVKKFVNNFKFKDALPFIFGLMGVIAGIYLAKYIPSNPNQPVIDYYESEMSVAVSPATLKKWVDNKDENYILVDLRSAAEYNKEHFITAVNIPASSMESQEVIDAFNALPHGKTVVVHCYSSYCTLATQIGNLLSQNGIYVKELNVGWSELRYHWDLWNPGAKVTDGEKYIVKGEVKSGDVITPCTEGEFGC